MEYLKYLHFPSNFYALIETNLNEPVVAMHIIRSVDG